MLISPNAIEHIILPFVKSLVNSLCQGVVLLQITSVEAVNERRAASDEETRVTDRY